MELIGPLDSNVDVHEGQKLHEKTIFYHQHHRLNWDLSIKNKIIVGA